MDIKNKVLEVTKTTLIPFLHGPSGEGKTALVKELAKELNKSLIILNLSAIESIDFSGLPSIKEGITVYSRPSWFNYDIIFLDEMDRVNDRNVRSALLSLIQDRAINGHALPEHTLLIGAGNGQIEGYDTIEGDTAYNERIIPIPFQRTIPEKIAYLNSKYPKSNFLKFMEVKTEYFDEFSTRRIDNFLKIENFELVENFFNPELKRVYRQFLEANLATLNDVMRGEYDKKSLGSMTRISLVIDLVREFYTFDANDNVCSNLNAFVQSLSAEEKANYFTRLKTLCLEENEKFSKRSNELNALGLFKGQKEFFSELTK